MQRTLVIGFGNIDRADDGVAYEVINALRRRLGQEGLSEDDSGLDALGAETDSIFLLQLTPELMETLAPYDQVIFVDAHVDRKLDDLHSGPVSPGYASPAFTHHMTPAMLLALLEAVYHRKPAGYLVSIRGRDFDFHRGLSEGARVYVVPAVDFIMKRIG